MNEHITVVPMLAQTTSESTRLVGSPHPTQTPTPKETFVTKPSIFSVELTVQDIQEIPNEFSPLNGYRATFHGGPFSQVQIQQRLQNLLYEEIRKIGVEVHAWHTDNQIPY